MIIKYKKYVGALILAEQLNKGRFKFVILDDNVQIEFNAEMNDIRILDCPGNEMILSELKKLYANNNK